MAGEVKPAAPDEERSRILHCGCGCAAFLLLETGIVLCVKCGANMVNIRCVNLSPPTDRKHLN